VCHLPLLDGTESAVCRGAGSAPTGWGALRARWRDFAEIVSPFDCVWTPKGRSKQRSIEEVHMSNVVLDLYGMTDGDLTFIEELAQGLWSASEARDEKEIVGTVLSGRRTELYFEQELQLTDTVAVLGAAIKDPTALGPLNPAVYGAYPRPLMFPPKSVEWGRQFIRTVLAEVRETVCGDKGTYAALRKEYDSYVKAFAVSISSSIMNLLGVSEPMALGLATLVLLILVSATKNAFCKMTDKEVLEAIDKKVTLERILKQP
jgi:hypothetical protein